jgi:hypothetical protein
MSLMVALLCMLAFSPRASGQTQVQKVPLVLTWNYDAQEKKLTLHLANNSGKDITAYTFSMAEKYTDGSTNPYYAEGIRHDIRDNERMEDLLGLMIAVQQAKGTSEEERMRREYGNGTFAAGTTRDQIIVETKDISDVEAIADVVIYADGTKDVENEDALKRIWASRQRALLATQKISQIVQNVLADQTDHPVAAALAELSRVAAEMTQYSVEAGGREQAMYDTGTRTLPSKRHADLEEPATAARESNRARAPCAVCRILGENGQTDGAALRAGTYCIDAVTADTPRVRRTWETPEPRRLNGGYTKKQTRVIAFKSRRRNGAGGGNRTHGLGIMRPSLCH